MNKRAGRGDDGEDYADDEQPRQTPVGDKKGDFHPENDPADPQISGDTAEHRFIDAAGQSTSELAYCWL